MKAAFQTLLHRLGLDVVRYDGRRFIARKRIEVISSRDVNIVLDVGAGIGQFAGSMRAEGYNGRIVSFEPVRESFTVLEKRTAGDLAWTCMNVALGAQDGEAVVKVAGNLWSSSLLPMTRVHEAAAPDSAYVRQETVGLARLDSLDVIRHEDRGYLKIDAQGTEAAVLDGAAGVLDRVVAAELELSLVELYEGQELLGALRDRLAADGFALVSLGHSGFRDPASDEILSIDGIFVRLAPDGNPAGC